MNDAQLNASDIINIYRNDITKLSRYLPWLKSKKSEKLLSMYGDNDLAKVSMPVPVYDSTLLRFVKEARETKLMDSNYVYVYSKFRVKTYKEEWKLIENCSIQEIYILKGILSKYVMKGMTKANVWSDAIEYSIFLKVVSRLKSLMDFWDGDQMNGR